jgi:hypothetical protein
MDTPPVRPTLVGNEAKQDITPTAAELAVAQPTVRLVLEAQAVDARSQQFQCSVRLENAGTRRLRIESLRTLTPLGTEVQRVLDTTQSQSRIQRDDLYRDLSLLLSAFLIKDSATYRKEVVDAFRNTLTEHFNVKGILRLYQSMAIGKLADAVKNMNENSRIWGISIRNSKRAQSYYEEFLKSREQEAKELCLIYKAKLEDVRQLESELGGGGQDQSVADVEPGGVFARTYVYNCKRQLLNPKTYTFSFDCGYLDHPAPAQAEPKHLAGSITAVISPKPLVLNVLAMISAILGVVLKIALDNSQTTDVHPQMVAPQPTLFSQLAGLVTMSACEAIVAAVITALFFYNVYDSTDMGRKLDVGTGWRSALIIGGLSGLLNQRVIAALHGLLG